jgi:Family of unknown function (DUF6282)
MHPMTSAKPLDADEILKGGIDLHHHGYPELSFACRTRYEDVDEVQEYKKAGLGGFVLKSHMWPTVGRAYLLRQLAPEIDIIPSITLNTIVGGFNPISVQSAGEQGARVLFMPTWSAANDLERGGFSTHISRYLPKIKELLPSKGLRVTSASGAVLPEVKECLAVAAEYHMLICTAHISPRESIALADCAKAYGISEIIFSHPDSNSVGATKEEIREMFSLGAAHEFCVNGFFPRSQRISPKKMIEIVNEVGADHAIITTDYFDEGEPSGAEMLRILVSTLLSMGMAPEALRKMVYDNPRRLLGKTSG